MGSRSNAVTKFLGFNELVSNANIWKSLIAEFIGTMFLVMIGCGSCIRNPNPVDIVRIALAFGLAVGIMVQCICHVSGGHINPAVSFGMLLTGNISLVRFLFYVLCQCAGAITGAALLRAFTPVAHQGFLGATLVSEGLSHAEGFGVEFFITFVLVFTVFAVCDANRTDVKGAAPIIIGLSVSACHLFAVVFTGSSMNPARSFGPAVIMNVWDNHWIYWIGPCLGGAAAALIYHFVLSASKPVEPDEPLAREEFKFKASDI